MNPRSIPFNRPYATGREAAYLRAAVDSGYLSGNGPLGSKCAEWLRDHVKGKAAFMTPSCTAALEMAMILADIGPGDEVIMPSYTFVSCANAVALRGGIPVFADIDEGTLNLDPDAVEASITSRTRAVIVVHYAGVGADMARLATICDRHGLVLIEDAAHCIHAWRDDQPLGSFGAMATFSFHETKNIQCGEGGALVVNDERLVERAEMVQEKGTNRRRFLRGQVDKYTWEDVGSSFLMSEISAAFLWSQIEASEEITSKRLALWDAYQSALAPHAYEGLVRLPTVPPECRHNAHLFAIRLADADSRDAFIALLGEQDIKCVFHYVPLHTSPAGRRLGRTSGSLDVTEAEAQKLVRLPLFTELGTDIERVIDASIATLRTLARQPAV